MMTNPQARTPVEVVLDALAARGSKTRQSGPGQWNAQCPVRDRHKNGDKNPSLSVHESPTGKAVVHCHSGCTWREVVGALDLRAGDLFPAEGPKTSTIGPNGQERARYRYVDEDGEILFEMRRFRDAEGRKTFRAYSPDGTPGIKGVRRVVYNLPQVRRAINEGLTVWVVEGEKDAENLSQVVDGAVTTVANGAITTDRSEWLAVLTEQLAGAGDVRIVADDDGPGHTHATFVTLALRGVVGQIRTYLPHEGHKDISEHLGAGRGLDELRYLDGPSEAEDTDDDWSPIDLAAIARAMRSGTWSPTVPTVLAVRNALPLFYAERINSLFGESGGGKTWVALAAVVEQLAAGGRVLFVDFEDTPAGIAERLVLLGVADDAFERLLYVNPATSLAYGLPSIDALGVLDLVVIDSTGEAMAAGGVDPNSDPETARWFADVKRLTRGPGGPCVIVLDHVPKDKDAPSTYAIGSQRKRAAVTGASYRVDTIKEPAKGKDGKLKLSVAKDRLGNRPKGSTAAIIDIGSAEREVTIEAHMTEAQEASAKGERFRPTVLMERVSRWVEINPGATRRTIEKNVSGRGEAIRTAIDVLLDEGWLVAEAGERGSVNCRSQRSFRELDDLAPVDNDQEAGTASHRVPPRPRASRDAVPSPDLTASPRPGVYTGTRDAVRGSLLDMVKHQRPRPTDSAPVDNSTPEIEEF